MSPFVMLWSMMGIFVIGGLWLLVFLIKRGGESASGKLTAVGVVLRMGAFLWMLFGVMSVLALAQVPLEPVSVLAQVLTFGVFIAWTYWVSQYWRARGESALAATLISALLGVFIWFAEGKFDTLTLLAPSLSFAVGAVIAAISRSSSDAQSRSRPASAELERPGLGNSLVQTVKKCASCAELIQVEAILCRYCGRSVSTATKQGADHGTRT